MSELVPPESYSTYRNRLLAASIPATAAAVFGATLAWQGALQASAPARFRNEWLPNLIQIAVPIAIWLLGRRRMRDRPETLLLAADITSRAGGRQIFPSTSLSGTALYVALKMMVTALLVPWGPRRQAISVAYTVTLLYIAFFFVGADLHGAPESHRWLGPLLAGCLSIVGASVADRVRRSVFEHERELEASAEHLRQEVEVDEALARVGRELIALPDTRRILDALCRLTTEVLACDVSHTFLWDPERQEFSAAAGFGDKPEQWEALRLVRYPNRMLQGFQERISAVDVEQFYIDEIPLPASALLRRFDTQVVLCVALRRGDTLMGVLSAEHRGRGIAFSAQQVRIARGIAHLASLALATARLVEELESANQLKSEFVATMSHERRLTTEHHHQLSKFARLVVRCAQRHATRSVTACRPRAREPFDLTTRRSIKAGSKPSLLHQLGPVDVAGLVDEVGRNRAPSPNQRAWSCAVWHPTRRLSRLDRVKLKIVLKNLVENAVKFTERGEVALQASWSNDGVEFRVADTGLGIAPEAQAAIFEPFRQIDSGNGGARGAGLGLYIVKQLMTALGGTIAVESALGKGSTFRIWLPLAATHERNLA